VAGFTTTYTANAASDFTAVINWGDGTSSAGTVSGANGSFAVLGSHSYSHPGSFTVTVQIADDAPGTATVTASATAAVGFPPVSQRFVQQVLLSSFLDGVLHSPGGAHQVLNNFFLMFGAAMLGSGPQAGRLVGDAFRFMADFVLGLEEMALRVNDPALQSAIQQVVFDIESSPLWQTALGFDLGAAAGGIALANTLP
jgi:hypothetical protein